ncbi:MAG: hypothetical protein ACR2QM_17595, partial [Longimicrobiales bacterium]
MSDTNDGITQDDALVEDYVEGTLTDDALSEFELRLQSDLVLRRQVRELRSLKGHLETLPSDAAVPSRVWDGIQARIRADQGESSHQPSIVALSSASASRENARRGGQRRFSFSVPQLAAAAIVLVSLGGALTWQMASVPTGLPSAIPNGTVSQVSTTGADGVGETNVVDALFAEYEASSAALMEIVNDGAPVLSDETLQIVRESVDAIDQAISEAREALK